MRCEETEFGIEDERSERDAEGALDIKDRNDADANADAGFCAAVPQNVG